MIKNDCNRRDSFLDSSTCYRQLKKLQGVEQLNTFWPSKKNLGLSDSPLFWWQMTSLWSRFTMCAMFDQFYLLVCNRWWASTIINSIFFLGGYITILNGSCFSQAIAIFHVGHFLPIQIQRKQFYFQCSYPAAIEHSHGNLLFPIRNISTFKVHFLATLRLPEGSPSRSVGCQQRLPFPPHFAYRGWKPITINTFRAMAISMCMDLNPKKKNKNKPPGDLFGLGRDRFFELPQVPFHWKELVFFFFVFVCYFYFLNHSCY